MTQSLDNVRRSVARTSSLLRNAYLWMALGLALTGLTGWLTARSPALLAAVYSSFLGPLLVVAVQLGLVFHLTSRLGRMGVAGAVASFILYSAVSGFTLSSIFLVYSGALITRAFLSACLMFAGMGLYALVSKRRLDSWANYLIMGLWGLVAATLLNLIFRSGTLDWIISLAGVGLFLALTAWDTQKIARLGWQAEDADEDSFVKLSIIAALTLYLDFFNIFLYLLRLTGRGSER